MMSDDDLVDEFKKRRQKSKVRRMIPMIFDVSQKLKSSPPHEVDIPTKPTTNNDDDPIFICSDSWLPDITKEIMSGLEKEGNIASSRVSPLVFARCDNGGKTRSLIEIAHYLRQQQQQQQQHDDDSDDGEGKGEEQEKIAILFVSFGGTMTPICDEEQSDPVQALLRRIAFIASHNNNNNNNNNQTARTTETGAFDAFRNRYDFFDEEQMIQWLDNNNSSSSNRILLILDDLDKLEALKDDTDSSIRKGCFGRFLEFNFLDRKGRYLVCASTDISSGDQVCAAVDNNRSWWRAPIRRQLPLLEHISSITTQQQQQVVSTRKKRLLSLGGGGDYQSIIRQKYISSIQKTGEAMYFGLIPGLIHNKGLDEETKKKKAIVLRNFIEKGRYIKELIVSSIVTGWRTGLEQYQLDYCSCDPNDGENKIRWSPYEIQIAMEDPIIQANESIGPIATALAKLCRQLRRDGSWENLFLLMLLVRCYEPGETIFLPWQYWYYGVQCYDLKIFYNRCDNSKRRFEDCTDWTELNEGIIFREDGQPTFSLFSFPSDSNFHPYDAIFVLSWNKDTMKVYGYQFVTQSKAYRPFPVKECFEKSFLISESPPPMTTTTNSQGWCIPSEEDINKFYGDCSGKHWTPQKWASVRSG